MSESIPIWLLGWLTGFTLGFVFWLIVTTRDHRKMVAKHNELSKIYIEAADKYRQASNELRLAREYRERGMGRVIAGTYREGDGKPH